MANQAEVKIGIGYTVDRAGLSEATKALKQVQDEAKNAMKSGGMTDELKNAATAAKQLEGILNEAWNSKLGQLDLSRVNSGIKETYGSVSNLKSIMESAGATSSTAFNKTASSILNTNLQLKQGSKLLNEMATSMANTVKWGIASSVFNNITGSIQKAYYYTLDLDRSLNDIRIVTSKSADDMDKFAVRANNAAKALGQSTTAYTNASLIYYQQGLSDEDVAARAETTLKAANVTGQNAQAVSEQLTAVWNGYKVSAEEAELYVDKLAAVAATTASDLEELSVGMSRVASAANLMGVDVDQLNAQLATIISVTRQAPESVGVALRSVYARMSDIQAGLDTETTLDNYTEQMAQMGVNVLDANNKLRDMGDVIEEVGDKWNTMSREQQVFLAQAMAGTRQYNNLLALFDNWDAYNEALETSANAMGTLQDQQDIYMESTEAHLQQLKTEAEETYGILFNADTVNDFTSALTGALGVFNNFLQGIGGGGASFLYFGSLVAKVFNNQIGGAIERQIQNMEALKANNNAIQMKQDVINAHAAQGETISGSAVDLEVKYAQQLLEVRSALTSEQYNALTAQQQEIGLLEQQIQSITNYGQLLEGIGFTEKESTQTIRNRLEYKETEVQAQKDLLEYTELCSLPLEEQVKHNERMRELSDQIFSENSDLSGLLVSIDDKYSQILEKIRSVDLSEEEINNSIIEQKELLQSNQQSINNANQALTYRQQIENGELDTLVQQRNALENIEQLEINRAARQKAISEAVNGLTSITMLLTTTSGIIKTLGDETLSTGEKVERVTSTLLVSLPLIISNLKAAKQLLPALKTLTTGTSAAAGGATAMGEAAAGAGTAAGGIGAAGLATFAAAAAAVVAVLGAIGVGAYLAVKAYNADSDAAKKAAAAAKEVKDSYDEIKTSYDELKDSLSQYQEAKDGLDELIKGTDEWKEKISEINEQVLELLELYPQLSQYVNPDENGMLGISQEGQDALLKEQANRVATTYQSSLLADIASNNAQNRSSITDFIRNNKYFDTTAVQGEGYTGTEISRETINEVIAAIKEHGLSILQNSETLKENTNVSQMEAEVLTKEGTKEELKALYKSVDSNTESNRVLSEAFANSMLGDTEFINSDFSNQLATVLGKKIEELNNDLSEQYKQMSDNDIQQRYIQEMGYDDYKLKSGGKVSYLNNGEWTEAISREVASAYLAAQDAQQKAKSSIEGYVNIFETLSDVAEESGNDSDSLKTALFNLASGIDDFGSITREEAVKLGQLDFSNLEKELDLLGTTPDDLEEKLGGLSQAWDEAAENVTEDMAVSAKKAFDKLDKSTLTLDDQKIISAILSRASAYGKLDEAIEAYKSGSVEGLQEFADTVLTSGENASAAATNFIELSKSLKTIKTGDTIDADVYDKLSTEGQSYFVKMLDNTYKLTKSADDLREVLQQDFISTIMDQINVLKMQNSNIQAVQNKDKYNFNTLSQKQDIASEENIGKQIDLIVALGDQSEETAIKVQKWREQLADSSIAETDLQEIADSVRLLGSAYTKSGEQLEANRQSMTEWARTLLASCNSVEQLEEYLNIVGEEGLDAFNERLSELQNAIDEDIDSEELYNLTEILQEAADDTEGIGTELADYLTEDKDAAEDVAEAILRFDDACKDVADSYEDWMSALESGNLQEQAEIMDDLRDAYADLLDLDGSSLSDTFLQSADNLELMRKAIDGDIDAYNQLLENAGEQILIDCGIDTTQFEADKVHIDSLINEVNWDDINVKATVEYSEFLNGLSDIVNAANMTAAQATDYLASMGIDAEVEAVKSEATDRREVNNLIAHPVDNITEGFDPASGNPVTYNFPSVTYTSEPADIIENKESTAFTLRVKSAHKSSGGGFKFNQAKSGGGSAGKARRAGKGGGGGGGGGKQPSTEKYIQKQADRYHDINQEVEKLDRSLERVQRDQEKLSGEDLLDNLNEQLDILEQQKAVYENKIRLEKDEANELRNTLAAEGATFDSEGYLTNYTAILQAKLDYVNNLIDQYNAMSAEEQEKFKEVIEQAKEDYDTLVDNINRYDEIRNEVADLEDKIEDAIDAQIEINIKKFTAEVEIRLDMAEAERDFNEFRRKVLDEIKDEDILGNAKADLRDYYSYLETYNTGTGPIEALTKQVNKTMDEVEALANGGYSEVYGKNSQKALEDLQNYYTELMDQLEDMQDLEEQIKESYLDMIDQAIDEFDDHVDQFEYINDLLNHDINLVGLLYGDDAYEDMDRYYKQIEANNNEELRFLRERVNYANEMMKIETDPEARKKWIEEWQNALEELNDKVEESVENIIDKYSNLIEQIFDKLNDKVTGGLGLDYVGEEWDLINKNSERYLDNINKMQALQDLENKYLEGIANTDDLVAQQKLRDVMDQQLAYLREKDKLTEYDVERANMMYELTLKQLALQNAQQTKTNLRLRRDSQGNYTYQYVSDEDDIAAKQKELLDAQNDLYNFDKNQYQQNLDDLYSIYEEFQEKLKELYLDPTIDPEERMKREQLLTQEYGELINGIVTENLYIRDNLYDSAFNDLAMLYNTDVQNFRNMSQQEQDELMGSLIPQWDSGVQHMADTFAGEGGFIPTCTEAFGELSETTQEYQNDLSDLEDAADVTFETLHDGITEGIEDTRELIEENDNLVSKYRDDLIPAIKDVISSLEDMKTEYDRVTQAAKDAAAAAYELAQARQAAAAAADWDDGYSPSGSSNIGPNILQNRTNSSSGGSSGGSGGSGGSSGGTGGSTKSGTSSSNYLFIGSSGRKYNKGQAVSVRNIPIFSSSSGASAKYLGTTTGTVYIQGYSKGSEHQVQIADSRGQNRRWANIGSFKTGGYTGEWPGNEGRAAILHEKELVLNQEDTKNILSAVNIIRHVDELASNLNVATSSRTNGLLGGLGLFGNRGYSGNSNIVDQNVHITAEFPGVRDSKEIEDALNNLVNAASMHAFNSRR